jgi:hypothetical protein
MSWQQEQPVDGAVADEQQTGRRVRIAYMRIKRVTRGGNLGGCVEVESRYGTAAAVDAEMQGTRKGCD